MVWKKAHKLTLDIYKETECFSERRKLWVNKPGAARFVFDRREHWRKAAVGDRMVKWVDLSR